MAAAAAVDALSGADGRQAAAPHGVPAHVAEGGL